MKIKEVYEKYKHLDHLLTDKEWLWNNFQGGIIYDLWQTIKSEVQSQTSEDQEK